MSDPGFEYMQWRKSSRSTQHGTDCVEVAPHRKQVFTRDSKDRSGPVLGFTQAEWDVFLDEVKRGTLDLA